MDKREHIHPASPVCAIIQLCKTFKCNTAYQTHRKRNSFTQSDCLHLKIYTVSVLDKTKTTAYNIFDIKMKKVQPTVFQVAELKAHMPMEMLRIIKRTFRDALGKLLNSKTLVHFDEDS